MKLELKHLAGYLPYNLKVMSEYGEFSEIDSVYFSKDEHKRPSLNLMVSYAPKGFRGSNYDRIKPILRPLSDLTKEIEVNGIKMNPLINLHSQGYNMNFDEEYTFEEFIKGDILNNSYGFIELLLKWHFDIYGLIENGLAIDINTLEI